MRAEDLVVPRIGDDLDEADALAETPGLAVGGERELGDLDVVALVLGLLLRVAERRDLRLRIGGPRDHVVVDGMGVLPRDRLGRDDALGLRGVRQHHLAGAVADGVDVGDVGAHLVVDGDGATLGERHAGVLEAVALGARGEADGREETVGLQHLLSAALRGADGDAHAGAGVLDRLDLRGGQHLDAELLVRLGELGRHVGVLGGHHAVEVLDDGDVRPELAQHVRELGADGAGATDDDGPRNGVGEDLLLVGDDVGRAARARQHARGGAGGDDRVLERDRAALPVIGGDGDAVGVDERAPAVDLGDLVLLHQEVDALGHPIRYLAAARERLAVVEGHLALDAVDVGLLEDDVRQLGVAQQRLGRDAADVEADTAPVPLLDDGHLLAQLGCADGRDVPGGTSAENNDVEFKAHEVTLALSPTLGAPCFAGAPASEPRSYLTHEIAWPA